MSIVKSIVDFFKSSDKHDKVDRYGILSPLMATSSYIDTTKKLYMLLINNSDIMNLFTTKNKNPSKYIEKALSAYHSYKAALSPHDQAMEKNSPLSTMIAALNTISANLDSIEDNFNVLFGAIEKEGEGSNLRSSSLFVIGYIEAADTFATWLTRFVAHLTDDDNDAISPYWTKMLLDEASTAGEFASTNLNQWNDRYKGILDTIKSMQKRGVDVAIKTEDIWMDEFAHDNQFTEKEQVLMSASLRNPILMKATGNVIKQQNKIALLTSKKDWLIAKIAIADAKSRGIDENSKEYKKLQTAIDYYTAQVTKYEQKIERLRS